MRFLLGIICILILAEGCKTAEKSVSKPEELQEKSMDQSTLSGTYIISEIGQKSKLKRKLTMTFDEANNRVSGFCGCNSFSGTYTIKEDNITFNDIYSSKKYCGENIGLLEQSFLSALKKTNRIQIADNVLNFYEDDVSVLKIKKPTASKPTKADMIGDHYNTTTITYQASSRGTFEYILIAKSGITISNDINLKVKKSYHCNPKDWQALNKTMETINIENLDRLVAPTDKRLHDGAPHATLSVIKGDVKMTTASFDHGAPPKEIEDLVNKVLSIKENVIKQ